MMRTRLATSFGIAWRIPSESGGEISGIGKNSVTANKEYLGNIEKEISDSYKKMRAKLKEKYMARFNETLPVTVHIILIPLDEKKALVSALHARLKALQLL